MSPFRWAIFTLFCYRPVRFIALDDFPLMMRLRKRLVTILGGDEPGQWGKLLTCPACLSVYVVTLLYVIDHYWTIPMPVLLAGATMTVAAFLGNYDS